MHAMGNNLPGATGQLDARYRPGPGPSSGGQLGGTGDGQNGADPRAPKMDPYPTSRFWRAWGQGQQGEPAGDDQQSFRRYGTQGFNDKLTVKDRHAYWDAGQQKTGTDFYGWAGAPPNSGNDPKVHPPRPDLRTVNRTVSYQLGTDNSRNQDDLTRAYTWLGEQGSGWSPVYGGVPGLYVPYGTRGGVPYPIVSPVEQGQPGDGRRDVFSGPPHGLHSQTPWKGGAQIIARFSSIPQTRPVRQDRPSNSPQAGQSYSQTVLPQGAGSPQAGRGRSGGAGGARPHQGRGWKGGRGRS